MSKKHKQKDQTTKQKSQSQTAAGMFAAHASPTDPQGSYTGHPTNTHEQPVQDADDL